MDKVNFSPLEDRIDYHFKDLYILQNALTHPSLGRTLDQKTGRHISYQRCEFLGDRVLGLSIADILFHLFPDQNEGTLAKALSYLVSRDVLFQIATGLDLSRFIPMSNGENREGTHQNPSVMADAMESLLGAVYMDGGFGAAHTLIHTLWNPILTGPPIFLEKDPKSALQEWSQSHKKGLPHYEIIGRDGPAHAPHFIVRATLKGISETGRGTSKRLAEQMAAKALLEKLKGL